MVKLVIFVRPRKEMHFISAKEASRYAEKHFIEDYFIIDEFVPLSMVGFIEN